jgi:teichuronic acid biosynthesis glycosyltransferase TuaC
MAIQNLLVITGRYPSAHDPMGGAFVQQLVVALSRFGVKCTVINPLALHKHMGAGKNGSKDGMELGACNEVVIRPRYFSFSSRQLGHFNTVILTQWAFDTAVRRVVQSLDVHPDAIYGHFLYLSGGAAVRLGKKLSKPAFVGVGESYLHRFNSSTLKRARRDFRTCTGFIAVSTPNKNFLLSQLGLPDEKIGVFNNGIDLNLFYPRDKFAARDALGIPGTLFVVAFVGTFSHNKGVSRLTQALQGLENTGAIFIGNGRLQPEPGSFLFKGQLPHERVPDILAAADIFVLPTLSEGCSNAILEALACGLPVISSEGEFNNDILDDSVSLRVDPQDISAIRAAIGKLRDDPDLREAMSKNALAWARKFDINLRAKQILEWMSKITNECT